MDDEKLKEEYELLFSMLDIGLISDKYLREKMKIFINDEFLDVKQTPVQIIQERLKKLNKAK